MRRAVQSGFTLIELLIVVGIIGLLSAVLVPQLLETKAVILARAEEGQLKKLGTFFTIYKARNKESLPVEGGHKLLLALWTSKVMNHTEENFGFFWTPESQDPVFLEKRAMVSKGEDPWPTLGAPARTTPTTPVAPRRSCAASATRRSSRRWPRPTTKA